MIPPHDEEYWSGRFGITCDDMDRVASQLDRAGIPQGLKAIALPILKGRLEHGHDPSPVAPGGYTVRTCIRFWDPAGEWQVGDAVILVHDRFGSSKYEACVGEITRVEMDAVDIRVWELQTIKTMLRTHPGICSAQQGGIAGDWREYVLEQAKIKLRSADPDEQAEGILLRHGALILSCLAEALRRDPRFIGLEGKWGLFHRLPHMDGGSLQAIHHFLLQAPGASLDDILPVLREHQAGDACLFKMAVHAALLGAADRFEETGTASHPQWKARLPARDQACVTHFAFDPQTFEILCRPGQRLSQKKVQRLQELDLYAHVVTFTEWRPQAQS